MSRSLKSIAVLLNLLRPCSSFSPFFYPFNKETVKHESFRPSFNLFATTDASKVDFEKNTVHPTRQMYPPATLLSNGTLAVDSIHTIYYEEYGKQNRTNTSNANNNMVALSLHGGPGAGCFPRHAQFFDPDKYERVILFDQRGCGRSSPRGETKSNTLDHLVHDIEKLRTHLGVEKFSVVLGGSWGVTLALAYAQSFPNRVGSIVLRGVCLFRVEEINWLFGNEADLNLDNEEDGRTNCLSNRHELLNAWTSFQDGVKDDGIDEDGGIRTILHKYYNHLLGNDPVARAIATKNWFRWEMGVSSFNLTSRLGCEDGDVGQLVTWEPSLKKWVSKNGEESFSTIETLRQLPQRAPKLAPPTSSTLRKIIALETSPSIEGNFSKADAEKFIPAQAMLTCYYSVNSAFMMTKYQLLEKENVDRIRHIPCIAVQGAKDLVCPPDSALDLCEAWPEMECKIVMHGKHSMYDPLITSELIEATDRAALLCKN